MVLITIVIGACKPTYITRGPHIVWGLTTDLTIKHGDFNGDSMVKLTVFFSHQGLLALVNHSCHLGASGNGRRILTNRNCHLQS